jgi:hypothetical protein
MIPKLRRGKLVIPEMGKARMELVKVDFTKAGVDQSWDLMFNKGRLLTDQVYTSYCESCFLRSIQHCKTLEDVIEFLKTWAYSMKWTIIHGPYEQKSLVAEIGKYNLNPYKLKGVLYWGRHTITFTPGYVHFLFAGITDDGTYEIYGVRHILKLIRQLVFSNDNYIHQKSYIELVIAMKKIEID